MMIHRRFGICLFLATWLVPGIVVRPDASAQTAYEIWSPQLDEHGKSTSECFFRKKFTLIRPESGEVHLMALDSFELFINSRPVSKGQSHGTPVILDVSSYLEPGVNLIAVQVEQKDSAQGGLAVKFRVKERGEVRWRSLTTDESWKTRADQIPNWTSTAYNDIGWLAANQVATFEFGSSDSAHTKKPITLGSNSNAETEDDSDRTNLTEPGVPNALGLQPPRTHEVNNAPVGSVIDYIARQGTMPPETEQSSDGHPGDANNVTSRNPRKKPSSIRPSQSAGGQTAKTTGQNSSQTNPKELESHPADSTERFQVGAEFAVQQVLLESEVGSVIALTFNEFNQLIVSQEGGGLYICDITRQQDDPKRIQVLCDEVQNCQGILALNGSVFVTGQGPEGLALYRLADPDPNGRMRVAQILLKFSGEPSEHGPHAIELGPDGMLYVIIGNSSTVLNPFAETSPYRNTYEGDLVPRMEDPGGHAVGVKAPGGTIVRVSVDGTKIERVCGGVRNAYDMVFDQYGELFIHDSDMESNLGMPWYLPTRVYHASTGADFGWRSGWANYPGNFADVVPPILNTGRGSPSGAVIYQHIQFPRKYHNTLFFADWSEGRILSVKVQPEEPRTRRLPRSS